MCPRCNVAAVAACCADIKVKEQSIENLMKGNKIYEPPRYMTVNQVGQRERGYGERVCECERRHMYSWMLSLNTVL